MGEESFDGKIWAHASMNAYDSLKGDEGISVSSGLGFVAVDIPTAPGANGGSQIATIIEFPAYFDFLLQLHTIW